MPEFSSSQNPAVRASLPSRIGDAMRTHQKTILIVQWGIVALYVFLLLAPLLLPLPDENARIASNVRLLAQFLFWGVGWPLIMLSMMLFGRVWCGLFCPDGTLTEAISRHGRHGSIPRWIRWSGWPCVMLVATTVYGQLVGVYDFHPATLLLLGLPTAGALLTGFLYGNGRRIWCMYLCPANGVFALLAKIAPLHFRVDETKWRAYQGRPFRVECAPLVDIRRMNGASDCHACGRCSGYRDAVELAVRAPDSEILANDERHQGNAQVATLIFGLLGVATVAMTWQGSRWFAGFQAFVRQALRLDALSALQQYGAPWWLLVNYPQANAVFSLFDGLCLLLVLLAGGGLLALVVGSMVWLAARIASDPLRSWRQLSLALVPMAGAGLILGLSLFTVKHLRAEGLVLAWLPYAQAALLMVGSLFSLWLAWRLTGLCRLVRRLSALAVFAVPVALMCAIWVAKLF